MCLHVFYVFYTFRADKCLARSFLPYESVRFALCFYTDIVPPVQIPHGGADHPNAAWFSHRPCLLKLDSQCFEISDSAGTRLRRFLSSKVGSFPQSSFAVDQSLHTKSAALKVKKDGTLHEADARLPRSLAVMYLDWRGEWQLRPLNVITTAPLLQDDGTIKSTEGYDPDSGMWCENVPDLTGLVPDQPDKVDLKADTSAAVVGFNLHSNTLARAEIMGLFKR